MKIIVTGSSGFIGFHLSMLLLRKGHKVLGIDNMNNYYDVKLKKSRLNLLVKNKNFTFKKINIENDKLITSVFRKFRPNIVIHLAAQAGVRYSIDKPRLYLKSNINGTFNVIEASYIVKVKHLIMASSSSVYGANKNIPFREIDKTETQLSIYAATKKLMRAWLIHILIFGIFQSRCLDFLQSMDHGADQIWHYSNLQRV